MSQGSFATLGMTRESVSSRGEAEGSFAAATPRTEHVVG
ncbi:MAG: hypothetical protein OJF58_000208 [Enhydrobacter sp.]|nr:MAG: hypothetical protein OJF58_000208 [Enhydrobacter sp.]